MPGSRDPSPAPVPQDSAEAKTVLRAGASYAGHLTRGCASATRDAQFAEANPSMPAVEILKEHLRDLRQTRNNAMNKYQNYRDLAPHRHDWVETRLTEFGALYDDAVQACLRGLAALAGAGFEAPSPVPAPGGGGGGRGGGGGVKVQESLKPQRLMRDSTPVELSEFKRQYRSFHVASKLDQLEITEQQAFFLSCLDHIVATEIRLRIGGTTPVLGDDNTCMSTISAYYEEIYPLFVRRLQFFRLKQKKGQDFAEFFASLRSHGDEANLGGITVDDIMVFRVLAAVTDDKLRDELLKRREPTLQQVLQDATAFEMAQRSAKATTRSEPASTKATRQLSLGTNQCHNCGKTPKCSPSDCRARDSKCHECQRKGHWKEFRGLLLCPNLRGARPRQGQGHQGHQGHQGRQGRQAKARATQQQQSERTAKVVCKQADSTSAPTPPLRVSICDQEGRRILAIDATPDTGTSRSVISADLIKGTTARIVSENINLVNASGMRMKTKGSVNLRVTSPQHGKTVDISAIVSPSLKQEFLLAWGDLIEMGVIPARFPKADASVVRQMSTTDAVAALVDQYPDVVGDDLGDSCGAIRGPPMTIHLKQGTDRRPMRVLTARPVPLHYAAAAEDLVEELLRAGVIVPVTEPTEWISPGFFVPKPGGKVRLVTDYKVLNDSVERPIHPFVAASDLVRQLKPNTRYYATMDFRHAYFQVPLDEASSYLTTFLLPFGRFRYRVAPMGLNSSSDEFCRRSDEAMAGLDFILKIVDDILIMASSEEELLERIKIVLNRCRAAGIRVSKAKLNTGTTVKFAGFIFNADGVSPDPDKTAAIRDFPAPTNLTELRSFLGLAQQLGHFAPDLSHMASRLRALLKKDVVFQWLPDHQKDFDGIKKVLCSPIVAKPFDPSLPTELLTDASRCYGIGCALVQRKPDGNLQLIHCASQSLTPAQRNYATVELEMMAVAWAIEKCSYYLRGISSFKVITDHKPLIGVFEKPLGTLVNARLLRFRQRLVDYTFTVEWSPGKDHCIADALSRRPVFAPGEEYEEDASASDAVCARMISDPAFESILDAAANDDHYKRLLNAVSSADKPVADEFAPYRAFWDRLWVEGEAEHQLVIFDEGKVVVPHDSRRDILRLLHLPHQGEEKTLATARQLYYWPGMKNSIRQICKECPACQAEQPSQQRLPLQPTHAAAPMEMVALDFFEWSGHHYLLMVDRFSSWPWVHKMRSTTTAATTDVLNSWFLEWGYPERIRSDNGPQFRGLFATWCKQHNILHETSSPWNPNSNGLAEAAVKSMKALLQKCHMTRENFDHALLEWRNTARADGISPAQAFLGRRQRTQLPCLSLPAFETTFAEAAEARDAAGATVKAEYDAHARDLPPLQVGDSVLLQDPKTKDWTEEGIILGQHAAGRSYDVKVDNSVVRRNRRFLKHNTLVQTNDEEESEPEPVASEAPLPRRSPRLQNKKK